MCLDDQNEYKWYERYHINANEKSHDYSGRSLFSDLIEFGTFAKGDVMQIVNMGVCGKISSNPSNLIGRVEEGGGDSA